MNTGLIVLTIALVIVLVVVGIILIRHSYNEEILIPGTIGVGLIVTAIAIFFAAPWYAYVIIAICIAALAVISHYLENSW